MRNAFLGLLTFSFASAASAVTFVEIGDAPQSVPGQDTVGGVQPLTEIVGTFAGFSDVDIYRIDIVDPANFRATTSGNDALDTQLFLFNSLGFGIAANDDRSVLDPECGLPSRDCWSDLGSIPGLSVGTYSLAVSRYAYMPSSSSGSIFPLNLVDETLDPVVGLVLPTGPGAGNPLATWANISAEDALFTDYTVSLTGVVGVPEPGTALLLAVGLVVCAVRRRGLR